MDFNVYPHEDNSGDWVVEIIDADGEGEISTTIFTGKNSEQRARASLKIHKQINMLTNKPTVEEVLDALEAIGVLPEGYCFCFGQAYKRDANRPDHAHTGECRDAREVIKRCRVPEGEN